MRRLDHFSYVLLCSYCLPGCYPQSVTVPSGPQTRAVEVLELQLETVQDSFQLLGESEPWRETTIYFEISGIVEQVYVEEGQFVQAGDPLAQLVPEDFRLACARAEAELEIARAQLDLLEAGTRKEDLEAARAEEQQARVRADYWLANWIATKRCSNGGP